MFTQMIQQVAMNGTQTILGNGAVVSKAWRWWLDT